MATSRKTKPSSKTAESAKPDWMARIKESSHDVLLAGIGALARARKDGAKPGKPGKGGKAAKGASADFETLVAEGRALEPELKGSLQKAWSGLKEKSRAPMAFKADGSKFKGVFEQRVAEALSRLGVPSAKEIDDLKRKVDDLLEKQQGGRAKAPARKAAAGKAPAKKSVARKAPARKAAAKKAPAAGAAAD